MELTKENRLFLANLTNLLNGQLRGVINNKARTINYQLIEMTLFNAFKTAKSEGYTEGKQEALAEEIKEELKRDIYSPDNKPKKNEGQRF